MHTHPKIISLQYCPGYRKPMTVVQEIECIANLGMANDSHARANSERQILLIERETLEQLQLSPCIVKENITTSGIDLMSLADGTRLRLGNDVLLELTKPCAPCSRMEEIRPGLLKEIAGRRGMLAKVITGGMLRIGDTITIGEQSR